jgi:hypothetical protein
MLATRLMVFCLVGLSVGLAVRVTRAVSAPPVAKVVENADASSDPITFGSEVRRDALIKADRLPIAFVSEEALQAHRIELTIARPAETTQSSETTTAEIVGRHWHDPNTFIAMDKPLLRWRSNEQHKRKGTARADKLCPEGAVHGLLRSLKLSPSCGTAVASADLASRPNRAAGAR